MAFGAIAFADSSSSESTLIVPRVVLGHRDGRNWITTIDDASLEDFNADAAPQPADTPSLAEPLAPGHLTRGGFKQAVASALEAIAAERVEKVVLARDLVAPLADDPAVDARLKALKLSVRCFPFADARAGAGADDDAVDGGGDAAQLAGDDALRAASEGRGTCIATGAPGASLAIIGRAF